MKRYFLAPHPDDETLWGSFTLLRHRPTVVCVLSCGAHRDAELHAACDVLGVPRETWSFPESEPDWPAIRDRIAMLGHAVIYAPAWAAGGNSDHNRIAELADETHPGRVVHYGTYTTAGKQTGGTIVPFEPDWVPLKLRALACYPSQSGHPSHAPHFMRSQEERYLLEDRWPDSL